MNKILLFTLLYILAFTVLPHESFGEVEYSIQPITGAQDFRFNNKNWHSVPHPEVASFTIFENGEMVGTTTTGVSFEQRIVENAQGVKVHKYAIQDHYHYILKDRIYYSTEALTRHLTSLTN